MEMRLHSPPMNSFSVTVSITSTLPCPGETTRFVPVGVIGSGSRKKYRVKTAKRIHRTKSAP